MMEERRILISFSPIFSFQMIKLLNKEWLNHAEKRHEKRVANMMRLADESRKSRFKRCEVLHKLNNGRVTYG